MQLTLEKRAIQSNFEGKELGFQIDTSGPWIFELLRHKFYADPIGSICREICDNARDAHREVGKRERPIEIWMPGEYLVIKDFGPGLSPERVEEIYRFYGKSTKRGDNVQGGGFGIGAKTPFAHTDQFYIETVHDQMKYVWLNYLDETKIGKLKLVSQQETLEENSTAIKIPIDYYSKQNFIEKILLFTQYWYLTGDAQPKYHGTIVDNTTKHVMESPTKNWVIFKNAQRINIIVNGIPYSSSEVSVPEGCVLIFNVGELDLAANRESLQNTKRNTQALLDKTQILYNEIHEIIQKDADNLELDQLFSLIDKFGIKQKEWDYKGVKFTYPLNKDYTYLYKTRYRSMIYHGNTNKLNNLIYGIITDDNWYTITPYTKQKIRQVMDEHGSKNLLLIKKDDTNPVFSFFPKIDIDAVKLKRYSNIPKRTKKTCLVYWVETGKTEEVDFNNTGEEIIYSTVNTLKINQRKVGHDYYMRYVSRACVITEGAEKKIKGNWISWEKYLERELWSKYTEQELQDIVNEKSWDNEHKEYLFLKDLDTQFNWSTKYGDINGWKLSKIQEKYTAQNKTFDFSKYPLIKLVDTRYLDSNDEQIVYDYVKEQLCKCNI